MWDIENGSFCKSYLKFYFVYAHSIKGHNGNLILYLNYTVAIGNFCPVYAEYIEHFPLIILHISFVAFEIS